MFHNDIRQKTFLGGRPKYCCLFVKFAVIGSAEYIMFTCACKINLTLRTGRAVTVLMILCADNGHVLHSRSTAVLSCLYTAVEPAEPVPCREYG